MPRAASTESRSRTADRRRPPPTAHRPSRRPPPTPIRQPRHPRERRVGRASQSAWRSKETREQLCHAGAPSASRNSCASASDGHACARPPVAKSQHPHPAAFEHVMQRRIVDGIGRPPDTRATACASPLPPSAAARTSVKWKTTPAFVDSPRTDARRSHGPAEEPARTAGIDEQTRAQGSGYRAAGRSAPCAVRPPLHGIEHHLVITGAQRDRPAPGSDRRRP
jgi:hypothetical protein